MPTKSLASATRSYMHSFCHRLKLLPALGGNYSNVFHNVDRDGKTTNVAVEVTLTTSVPKSIAKPAFNCMHLVLILNFHKAGDCQTFIKYIHVLNPTVLSNKHVFPINYLKYTNINLRYCQVNSIHLALGQFCSLLVPAARGSWCQIVIYRRHSTTITRFIAFYNITWQLFCCVPLVWYDH